jgi:hypothetical protein
VPCGSNANACMAFNVNITCATGVNTDLPSKFIVYSINASSISGSTYNNNATGTPIYYGDLVTLYWDTTDTIYENDDTINIYTYWQTVGSGNAYNNINLTEGTGSGSSTIDTDYQLWTLVDPTNSGGVFNSSSVKNPNVTTVQVMYDDQVWIQSVGKYINNTSNKYYFSSVDTTDNGNYCLLQANSNSSLPNNNNYIFTVQLYQNNPPTPPVGSGIKSGDQLTVGSLLSNSFAAVNINNNTTDVPCGPDMNACFSFANIFSGSNNSAIGQFIIYGITTSTSSSTTLYTAFETGTAINYGDLIALEWINSPPGNKYVYWQTGGCASTCNDNINLTEGQGSASVSIDSDYQLWVLARPNKSDLITTGGTPPKGNDSGIQVNYGDSFWIQSAGKAANNSGNAYLATFVGSNILSAPYVKTLPASNDPTYLFFFQEYVPPPAQALTAAQQFPYDNGKGAVGKSKEFLTIYIIIAIVLVALALIYRIYIEIERSNKKK